MHWLKGGHSWQVIHLLEGLQGEYAGSILMINIRWPSTSTFITVHMTNGDRNTIKKVMRHDESMS